MRRGYNIVVKYLLLFFFWQLLSGSWNWHNIIIGLVVSLLVTKLSENLFNTSRLDFLSGLNKITMCGKFFIKFLIEIIKSNIAMAKIVVDPKLPISPGVIRLRTGLKSDLGKMILANTITLTPGTLTMDVNDDELIVHMITKDNLKNLLSNDLEELLVKIEED